MADEHVTVRASGPLFEQGRDWQQIFDTEISAELIELGGIGQRILVSETPRGASGLLRGSIATQLRGQAARREMAIFSSAFYAPIVDRGRRPGKRPPTAALVLWVSRKLGISDQRQARSVAFAIANKIGRVGTAGAAMFFKAAQRLAPIAAQRWQALGERLVNRLEGR